MAEIISFNSSDRPSSYKKNPLKAILNDFKSLDKFTRIQILSIIFVLIAIPGITTGYLILRPHANQISTCPISNVSQLGKKPDVNQANLVISELEDANSKLAQSYQKGTLKDQQDSAKNRASIMLEAMQLNPNQALNHIASSDDREKIHAASPGCEESLVEVTGNVEITDADYFSDKTSQALYVLNTSSGKIQIDLAGNNRNNLIAGKSIKVKGYQLNNQLLVDSNDPSAIQSNVSSFKPNPLLNKANASIPDDLGPQNTIVLLANFSNTSQPSYTSNDANNDVFNLTNNFYTENSYNKMNITGTTYGWYTSTSPAVCDMNSVLTGAIQAADPYVDFSKYSRIIIIHPFIALGCWGGLGTIGKISVPTADGVISASVSWVVLDSPLYGNGQPKSYDLEHELGHNLGFGHAQQVNCGAQSLLQPLTGCTFSEYGDQFSMMGANPVHLDGFYEDLAGWSQGPITTVVSSSGSYTMEGIEPNTNNTKIIKIPRGDGTYLYVEYRTPVGSDANIPTFAANSDVFNGVLIHVQNPNDPTQSGVVDASPPVDQTYSEVTPALLLNQTFTDPLSGSTITLTGINSSSATVYVKLNSPVPTPTVNPTSSPVPTFTPSPSPTLLPTPTPQQHYPTVTITSPTNGSIVATKNNITIAASASDSIGITKVNFFVNGSLTCTDLSYPYSCSWNVPATKRKSYTLSATAYNSSGNYSTSSISVSTR